MCLKHTVRPYPPFNDTRQPHVFPVHHGEYVLQRFAPMETKMNIMQTPVTPQVLSTHPTPSSLPRRTASVLAVSIALALMSAQAKAQVTIGNTNTSSAQGDITGGVRFTANGTLNLSGSADQSVSGAITTSANAQGNVIVSNTGGTVTFNNNLGASSATLNTFTLGANTRTVFGNNVTVHTTNLALTGPSTLTVGGTSSRSGDIVITTTNITDTGTKTIRVDNADVLSSGRSLILISASGGGINSANYQVSSIGNALTTVIHEVNPGGTTLTLRNTGFRPPCDIAPELGITISSSFALVNADISLDDGSAAQTALNTALNAGGTVAQQAAKQIAVQADTLGAIRTVALTVDSLVSNVLSTRLARQQDE